MLRGIFFGQSVALWLCASAHGQPSTPADLIPRPATTQQIVRVKAHLEAGGDLTMAAQDGKSQKVPMSVVADLRYDERRLAGRAAEGSHGPGTESTNFQRSLRHYDQAQATIKIGTGGVALPLPAEKRLIVASTTKDTADLFSPSGPLTREELDLIDVPAGTHVVDLLMPAASKRAGETWKHDAETMRLLLGLDAVEKCDVESTLIGVERGYAKLRLAGSLHGTTDGAPTALEVKAGYLFDPRLGRITRLNLAFSEKREEGRIGPAVDVVGKLTLEVDPIPSSEHLDDEQWAALPLEPAADQMLLEVKDEPTGLRLLHDREWYVTSQERERLVLRRIDGGEFLAQCNVSIRPERKEGRQTTMPEFERDVRFSLGNRFETLVTSGEWTSAPGLRCYRMVVHGKVDDLPMEWRYYLASPSSGRSVALAFSVEPHLADRLGEADMAIVESVQLTTAASSPERPGQAASAQKAASTRAR